MVTRPGFGGCLNCRWLPLVPTWYQPSLSTMRIASRTLGGIQHSCSIRLVPCNHTSGATEWRDPCRIDSGAFSHGIDLILDQMNANRFRRLAVVDVAKHSVAHHVNQFIPIIALGEYAVPDGAGRVPTVGGLPYLEGYFRLRCTGVALLSGFQNFLFEGLQPSGFDILFKLTVPPLPVVVPYSLHQLGEFGFGQCHDGLLYLGNGHCRR